MGGGGTKRALGSTQKVRRGSFVSYKRALHQNCVKSNTHTPSLPPGSQYGAHISSREVLDEAPE